MTEKTHKIFRYFLFFVGGLVGLIILYYVVVAIAMSTGGMVQYNGRWMFKFSYNKLMKDFPPQYYEAPAKNMPEDVYAAFREAILAGDTEKALGYVREEKREVYREGFKNKEKFEAWKKRLPEKLMKESESGNFSYFYYKNGVDLKDDIVHRVNFVKNREGYWEIDMI